MQPSQVVRSVILSPRSGTAAIRERPTKARFIPRDPLARLIVRYAFLKDTERVIGEGRGRWDKVNIRGKDIAKIGRIETILIEVRVTRNENTRGGESEKRPSLHFRTSTFILRLLPFDSNVKEPRLSLFFGEIEDISENSK